MSFISLRPESRLPPSTHDSITRAGPSYESYSSGTLKPPPDRPSKLRRLRPWSFSSRSSPGRTESGANSLNHPEPLAQASGHPDTEVDRIIEPYELLRVRDHEPSSPGESSKPTRPNILTRTRRSSAQRWSDSEEDDQADSYSWVDNDQSGNAQRAQRGVSSCHWLLVSLITLRVYAADFRCQNHPVPLARRLVQSAMPLASPSAYLLPPLA